MKKIKFKKIAIAASLLICFGASGQIPEPILSSFQNQQKYFVEKIFVHTDKPTYFANEILWFKLYNVSNVKDGLSTISKIAYVELLDKRNNPQMQTMVALNEGTANGSLELSKLIETGKYKLRAYTNLMKNAGAEAFFEKDVYIINPLKITQSANVQKKGYDISFFAEGGEMVDGILGNVAFKAIDKDGVGTDFKGVIVDDKNDTVAVIKSLKFGIGKFAFTPILGRKYKAVCIMHDKEILIKQLPDASPKGYGLRLTKHEDEIVISVNSNMRTNDVYIVIHNGKSIAYAKASKLTNGTAEISIKRSTLSDGVYYLTTFNAEGNPVAERMFFNGFKDKLSFKAELAKTEYLNRERVELKLSALDEQFRPKLSNASLSVYKVDSIQTSVDIDIVSELYLKSEIRGYVENPSYYFSSDKREVLEALDNLLLTQGWRKFDLKKQVNPVLRFLPEYNGHLVSGKVLSENRTPVKNLPLYFSSPKKQGAFYITKTDSSGAFLFNTDRLYGENELIIQSDYTKDSTSTIVISNPYFEEYTSTTTQEDEVDLSSNKETLENYYFSSQVQDIYARRLSRNFSNPVSAKKFYNEADRSYNLQDFTKFSTLEEIFREYIKEIHVFKRKGSIALRAVGGQEIFESDPLILYDGIPYFDLNKMMAVHPDDIERIEIFKNRYFYSGESFAGIVQFFSKKATISDYELNPNAIVIDYDAMQLQREFYAPRYDSVENAKKRLPDYRTTLHWEPNISFNTKDETRISFYTSDISGKYIGVIQGIGIDGTAGFHTFKIDVK